MKIYKKIVDCCECCPSYKRINISRFGCYSEHGTIIKDGSIVQDWCPLEDAPNNAIHSDGEGQCLKGSIDKEKCLELADRLFK